MFHRHFSAQAVSTTKDSVGFMLRCNETHAWGSYRFDRGLKCMDLVNLLMVDWDPAAEGSSVDDHYTVKNKKEVLEIINSRVETHLDELWRVYETPSGGIHAFLMSHKYTPSEGEGVLTEMKGDLLYRDFSLKRNKWAVRVGPKPNRANDFVARFIGNFGKGIALSDHLKTIKIHDSFLP